MNEYAGKPLLEIFMRSYHIYEAAQNDNYAILDLIARNPVEGGVVYYKDRSPNYFQLLNLFAGSRCYLASGESAGREAILGMMTGLLMRGNMGGKIAPYLYLTDLNRAPESSRLGVVRELFYRGWGLDFVKEAEGFFGVVNPGNRRALSLALSSKLPVKMEEAASLSIIEMIPLRRRRVPKHVEISTPGSTEELREALIFINQFYRNHFLYMPIDAERYLKMCKEWPSLSMENILILRSGGNIKGALFHYDPEELTRLKIKKYDKKTKKILSVIRYLYALTGWPFRPPKEGESIKKIVIRAFAWEDSSGKHLLSHLNNLARENGYHAIAQIYDNRAPMPFRTGITLTFPMSLFGALKHGKALHDEMGGKPVFLDMTTV